MGIQLWRVQMLVLSRSKHESVEIANSVILTVVEIRKNRVAYRFSAPEHILVYREEEPRELPEKAGKKITSLILRRKKNQVLVIPSLNVRIQTVRINGKKVRIAFEAPDQVRILRTELELVT